MSHINKTTYVALDIETTDLSPDQGFIIEIGAYKFMGRKTIAKFSKLIKSPVAIPSLVTCLTGIKNEDLENAPNLDEIKQELVSFIGDLPLIGHNLAFDLGFLKAKGLDFTDNEYFDTWQLSYSLLPNFNSYSLEYLTKELGITHVDTHRAYDDAKASAELFLLLHQQVAGLKSAEKEHLCTIIDDYKSSLAKFIKLSVKSKLSESKIELGLNGDSSSIKNHAYSSSHKELKNLITETISSQEKLLIENNLEFGNNTFLPSLEEVAEKHKKPLTIFLTSNYLLNDFREYLSSKNSKVTKYSFFTKRSNFICLRRFQLLQKSGLSDKYLPDLVRISIWLSKNPTGWLSDVILYFGSSLKPTFISSEKKSCPGKKCPHYHNCFYYCALQKLNKTGLVISDNIAHQKLPHDIIIPDTFNLPGFINESDTTSLYLEDVFAHLQNLNHLIKPQFVSTHYSELKKDISKFKNSLTLFFGLIGIYISKNKPDPKKSYLALSPSSPMPDQNILESFKKVTASIEQIKKKIETAKEKSSSSSSTLDLKFHEEDNNFVYEYDLPAGINQIQKKLELIGNIISPDDKKSFYWINSFNEKVSFHKANKSEVTRNKLVKSHSLVAYSGGLSVKNSLDFFASTIRANIDFKYKVLPSKKKPTILLYKSIPTVYQSVYKDFLIKLLKNLSQYNKSVVLLPSNRYVETLYPEIYENLSEMNLATIATGFSGGSEKVAGKFKDASLLVTTEYALRENILEQNPDNLIITKLPFYFPKNPYEESLDKKYPDPYPEYVLPKTIIALKKILTKFYEHNYTAKVHLLDTRIFDFKFSIIRDSLDNYTLEETTFE